MSENENKSESSTDKNQQDEQKVAGRRKFLKGAAAASPVLMTVASKPVWAANCSLSGELSGNLSQVDDQPCDSEGCSPGYWGHRGSMMATGTLGGWHPNFPPGMLFDEAFDRPVFYDKTLLQVINFSQFSDKELKHRVDVNVNNCTDKNCKKLIIQLAFHSAAALQNAATNVRFPYSVMGADPAYPSVIALFQHAWDNSNKDDIEALKGDFDNANNLGCPFNRW